MNKLNIILSGIVRNNPTFVLVLGMCPTLGTTTSAANGMGMGLATTFVMTLASICAWWIDTWILIPLGLTYLRTLAFILVIAVVVQFTEMVVRKTSPVLYRLLGIFLPLITTNCVILGVAILVIQKDYNLMQSIVFAISTAIGYSMALIIFATIREQLALTRVPDALKGTPIALITAGLLAMAFMGFSGVV